MTTYAQRPPQLPAPVDDRAAAPAYSPLDQQTNRYLHEFSNDVQTRLTNLETPAVFVQSPFQNLIANGGFEVWQMGTTASIGAGNGRSGAPAGVLCALPDRWSYINSAASGTDTVSRQPGFGNGSNYCLRWQRTAASTDTGRRNILQDIGTTATQKIAGQTVTLSFTARIGAGTGLSQFFTFVTSGTGIDEPRRTGYTGQATIATYLQNTQLLSTTAQSFQCSFQVPAGISEMAVLFSWFPSGTAGATDYIEIDNVQLNLGTTALPFESMDFDVELRRCMTWVQKSFPYATAPAQNAGTTGYVFPSSKGASAALVRAPSITLSPPLRAGSSPQATTYNPFAANAQVRNNTALQDCTSTALIADEHFARLTCTSSAATAVGDQMTVHYVLDAGI